MIIVAQEKLWAFQHDMSFLQIVSDISGLPCVFWSEAALWISGENTPHPCGTDQTLRKRLESECMPDKPGIFMESEYVFWGLMRLGDYIIALGPALCNEPNPKYAGQYAAGHGLSDPCVLRKTGFGEMSKWLALMSCHFFGRGIPYDQITAMGVGTDHTVWESERDFTEYRFAQSEYDRSHRRGADFEDELARAVRSGDVEGVKQLIGGTMPDIGETGVVAKEERKQMEYMLVSIITILTRAAIEGGMRSEAAHDLGDVYLRRLASASTHGGAFTTLGLRAMTEFAEGVRQARNERSSRSHIEACKAYVEENLLKNLQVSQIAPALGLSRTYLAHLFKAEEGITLQQYIQREKCRHAERLLRYSDYPISLIAEYYGFSSPGYFGTCFQQWYGMTPNQYRRANARN